MPPETPANWYTTGAEGLDIRVRLTPRGGADRIDGVTALSGGSRVLAARVRAVPEKGSANAALEKLVAGALGVARATVSVASGHKARIKTVHVSGNAKDLIGALTALETDEPGKST